MEECEIQEFDGFFTDADFEDFKKCSQIVFKNVSFKEENIGVISGKQNLKKVLSFLFRAGDCPDKNGNSIDNWYSYVEGKDHIRLACLFDDMDRDNAVLKAMQHIKRDTGFEVPYVLLRFDLYYDVEDGMSGSLESDGGYQHVDFMGRTLKLSDKYMHFLGMQATSGIDHVMRELKMPKYRVPVVCCLVTDSPTEYWSYYILVSSEQFELEDWQPPI